MVVVSSEWVVAGGSVGGSVVGRGINSTKKLSQEFTRYYSFKVSSY
jgi:hypothetical protein